MILALGIVIGMAIGALGGFMAATLLRGMDGGDQ